MPVSNERIRWRDLLGVVAPVLALLSVLAFAVVHVSYDRFYAQFGLAPEDVGADSTRILAQSGAHVAAYSFFFAIVPYGLTLVAFTLLEHALPRSPFSRRLLLVVPALVPMAIYQEVTGAGILGWYMLVSGLTLVLYVWWTSNADAQTWQAVLLWFSVGIFWLNLFYLPSAAARAAHCVTKNGMALRTVHTRRKIPGKPRTAVLALRAQPAVVQWLGSADTRPRLGARLLYLGEASGTDVFYDADRQAALRIPAGEIAISTPAHPELCPEFG